MIPTTGIIAFFYAVRGLSVRIHPLPQSLISKRPVAHVRTIAVALPNDTAKRLI
ncbi:MAG: hypothetical protein GF363_01815 [Chitinivibrionales bacterium]|nr:hypothetical protein [Chitinivibrionales bacterium]